MSGLRSSGGVSEISDPHEPDSLAFGAFVEAVEPRLRRALIARYGRDQGLEATAEALGWAWEHRERMAAVDQPVAYLYRVGQSRSRRRKERLFLERDVFREPEVEPRLSAAVSRLSERQRVVVLLVHGADWTPSEVADLLSIDVSSVQTHLRRALARLRSTLEESS